MYVTLVGLLLASATPAQQSQPSEAEIQLRAKVDSWIAEAEPMSTWSERERLISEDVAKGQKLLWTECLIRNRNRLSSSKEQIELVATAVLSSCQNEEYKLKRTTKLALRGLMEPLERQDRADKVVEKLRLQFREQLIGFLVEKRLN